MIVDKSIHCFTSMNEKNRLTKDRLYHAERKRRRASGITEVRGQQKSTEKLRHQRKAAKSSSPYPWLPSMEERKMKIQSQGKPDGPGNRLSLPPENFTPVQAFGERVTALV
jgi:hypothetical protein